MKYTVTINQYGAARAGLINQVDIVDLAIFDAFKDFANSGRCSKIYRYGKQWFWIDYTLVIRELPFIPIKTKDAVYRRMKNLADAGIIEFCPDNKRLGQSFFSWGPNYDILVTASAIPLRMENRRGTDENPEGYGYKSAPPPDEKPEYHNTNEPSTNQKTKPSEPAAKEGKKGKADILKEQAVAALEYLNLVCGRAFQMTGANLKFPLARLKDGATLDNLKLIVDHKNHMWGNTPRSEYLRPSTLFQAEKFDGYLDSAKRWADGAGAGAGTGSAITAARNSGIYNAS